MRTEIRGHYTRNVAIFKEEGRRKKEEGRRKKEEGRRRKEERFTHQHDMQYVMASFHYDILDD